MANHPNRNQRYAECRPAILAGRQVWIASDMGSVPTVWVHLSPYRPAVNIARGTYFRGTDMLGLDLGRVADWARPEIEAARPISPRLAAQWERERQIENTPSEELLSQFEADWFGTPR